jgi:thioredoxin-dependent peroxiredoxin
MAALKPGEKAPAFTLYGKKTWGIIRSAFLLDEKGKIAGAWYRISPKDTVPKALAALEGRA